MSFAAQFLEVPELFPQRSAGESPGDGELILDFVGGPYRFVGLSEDQLRRLTTRYADLAVDGVTSAVVESRIFSIARSEFRTFDLAGWHLEIDFDYGPQAVSAAGLGWLGRFEGVDSPPDGASPVERGSGSSASRLRGALWTPEHRGPALDGAFENFFRTLVAYRLLEAGGVLLHSAALVGPDDRARLFFGPSGAGKSTLSRIGLEAGLEVLSDDVNALVLPAGDRSEARVEKLPFAGDLGQTGSRSRAYPVAGLYRLVQASGNRVRASTPGKAIAFLVACAPFVNADPHRQPRLLEVLESLIESVPGHELHFRPEPEVLAAVFEDLDQEADPVRIDPEEEAR